MKKRILLFALFWIGLNIFSSKFSEITSSTRLEVMESLVFEPFSWFFAVLFFIVSFIALSKLIFTILISRMHLAELICLTVMFLFLLFYYKTASFIVIFFAIVYASLEIRDHTKRIKRYRGSRST